MHCLVYHIPDMIKRYGNIKQFSGQETVNNFYASLLTGVKNNNIAKRNYFSSNMHDVTGEVLKAEWQQEQTKEYKRKKRNYTKHNCDYREINKKKKEAKTSIVCSRS